MSRLNRLLTAKTVRSSYMEDEVDQHGADELRLFIDNDADLYRQQYIPIVQNLMRKRAAKVYDSEKAVTLFMYLVESGAKKYAKEAGSPDQPWHVMFPKETRLDTARQLRDHFEGEADLGNWDHYIPKKYGGTGKYKEVPKGALESAIYHAEADEIEVTDPEEAKKVDDVLKKSGAKATTLKSGKSIKYRFANKSEYDKATKELSKEASFARAKLARPVSALWDEIDGWYSVADPDSALENPEYFYSEDGDTWYTEDGKLADTDEFHMMKIRLVGGPKDGTTI